MPTLDANEGIRYQGPGVLRRTPGVLTITTERVLFTHTTGAPRRREHLDLSMPLESIYAVELERELGKLRLVLVAHGRGYEGPPRTHIELSRPPDLPQLIHDLIAERRQSMEEAKERERASRSPAVHVTVQTPPSTPRVMFRCPYCRTVYPELEAKCPSCGATF